jgi:hypothetical protein
MRELSHAVLLVTFLSPLAPSTVSGQSTAATLSGTIYDEQHAALPGAFVTLRSTETERTHATRSDGRGVFRLVGLPPGRYELTLVLAGFQTEIRDDLTLSIAQEAALELTMKVAKLETNLTVTAPEVPLVEPAKTALGGAITTAQIDQLPIPGRNYGNFGSLATLTPGILDVNSALTPIATAGQTVQNNTFLIDGFSMDDSLNAALRGSFSIDAIKEFIVFSNSFSAEYGHASGAVVNVLTRSGTNRFEGRGFYFHEADSWDARPAPAGLADPPQPKVPFSQQIVGGFFGGPVIRDRAFFFGSVEQVLTDTEYINTSKVTRAFKPDDPVTLPSQRRNPKVLVRGDVMTRSSNTLTLRYRDHYDTGINALREDLSVAERGLDAFDHVPDVALVDAYAPRATALNEARLQFGRRRLEYNDDDYCHGCPSENRPGILLGGRMNAPQLRIEDRWQASDAFTYLMSNKYGEHTVKAGVDTLVTRENSYFPFNVSGTFKFSTDRPYDPADFGTYPTQYTRSAGDPHVKLSDTSASFFVQDQWKPVASLTLNVGLRWDYDDGTVIPQHQHAVAPRLGIAWSPWRDGRTIVRGGYGIFYDRVLLGVARSAKNAFVQTLITNPGYPDPFGYNPRRTGEALPPSTTRFAQDVSTPFTEQATVGLQRQFGAL